MTSAFSRLFINEHRFLNCLAKFNCLPHSYSILPRCRANEDQRQFCTINKPSTAKPFKHASIIKKNNRERERTLSKEHYTANFAIIDRRIFVNIRENEEEIYVSIGQLLFVKERKADIYLSLSATRTLLTYLKEILKLKIGNIRDNNQFDEEKCLYNKKFSDYKRDFTVKYIELNNKKFLIIEQFNKNYSLDGFKMKIPNDAIQPLINILTQMFNNERIKQLEEKDMERKHQAIESRPQNLNNEKSKKQDLMKRSFKVGDKRVFVDVKYDKETNSFYVILGEVWAKKSRNVYINISVVKILKECLNESIPYMDEKLVARSNFEQETDMGLLVLYSKTFNDRNLEFTFEIYSGKRGIAENRFIRFYRKDRNKGSLHEIFIPNAGVIQLRDLLNEIILAEKNGNLKGLISTPEQEEEMPIMF